MKLLPEEFTFGDVCVFVCVYEREGERWELLKYFGVAGHRFIRLSRVL